MVEASHVLKKQANSQYAASDFSSAIGTYDRAVAELPNYLDFELAVLQSNIAACHIKLEQWKEAVDACERALNGLAKEMPMPKPKDREGKDVRSRNKGKAKRETLNSDTDSETEETSGPNPTDVVELPSDNDEEADARALQQLAISDQRKADIQRIRTKTLLRRARAKSSMTPANWTNLGGALEDYTLLSTPEYFNTLPPSDQRTVRVALAELPPKVNAAKEREVSEMMGKLKELGNGILRPFGLSTDMFKMVKDENTGGYSMTFDQGGGGGKKGQD